MWKTSDEFILLKLKFVLMVVWAFGRLSALSGIDVEKVSIFGCRSIQLIEGWMNLFESIRMVVMDSMVFVVFRVCLIMDLVEVIGGKFSVFRSSVFDYEVIFLGFVSVVVRCPLMKSIFEGSIFVLVRVL